MLKPLVHRGSERISRKKKRGYYLNIRVLLSRTRLSMHWLKNILSQHGQQLMIHVIIMMLDHIIMTATILS